MFFLISSKARIIVLRVVVWRVTLCCCVFMRLFYVPSKLSYNASAASRYSEDAKRLSSVREVLGNAPPDYLSKIDITW